MTQFLIFTLLGLGPGALIAAVALGVVLSYRGSGVINLATGAIAMFAGYTFWALRTGQIADVTLSTALALVVSLVIVLIFGTIMELVVFRPLRTASPLAKLVASLGVLLTLQAVVLLAFGTTPEPEPNVLPQHVIHILGAVIPEDRFLLTGIVAIMALLLAGLYRWSRFGLATRAASENQTAAMLGGLYPSRLSLINTLLATLVAGALGIFASSVTELDPSTLPLQIVPALAAALLAGFTSFGIACAAGIGLGIMESLVEYVSGLSWFPTSHGTAIPGVAELITFVIIAAVLYFRGARLPTRGAPVEQRLPLVPRPQNLVRTSLMVALVCGICLVVFPYDFREALINTLIGTCMALSLVVLIGFVGQISVVQLALAGVSGFVISHLAVNAGIGFPFAPIIGTGVAVLFGVLTALSAVRVRGVSLAVVTLAAAVAIENFGFDNQTWGGGLTGSPVPSPHLLNLNLGPSSAFRGLDGNQPSPVFGWVVLGVTIALCLMVGYIRRGRIGQRMLAVRSNERAAAAAAINPRNVKLVAFGISAFVAGIAGCLYAYNFGSVSATNFDAITALSLIAFAFAGGITLISGAAFAGFISTQALFPYALDKWLGIDGNWFLLFGGLILIFTLIRNPDGVAGDVYRRLHRRPQFSPDLRLPEHGAVSELAVGIREPRVNGAAAVAPVLEIEGLSVVFGGHKALNQVGLEVAPGELVGLIGPNGAGKTTLIDAITGFVPANGVVKLDGREIQQLPAHARSSEGLARTWQGTDLFEDLDVYENLLVATGSRAADQAKRQVEQILSAMGLEDVALAMPHELSEGQRKVVGLARAVAGGPRILCLDEPAAGLDTHESQLLGRRLRDLADRGQSTLLIDHDMGLVLGVCDRVVVLEFGEVIANDVPSVVRNDPAVVAAYLGSAGSTAVGDVRG